jgi:hypothetical protein
MEELNLFRQYVITESDQTKVHLILAVDRTIPLPGYTEIEIAVE